MEYRNPHTFVVAWGKFTQTLEDVSHFTLLPLFGKGNTIRVVLEEENQIKLKFLMAAMTTSRILGNLTYPILLRLFYEGDSKPLRVRCRGILSWCVMFVELEDGVIHCLPAGNFDLEERAICPSPLYLVSLHKTG